MPECSPKMSVYFKQSMLVQSALPAIDAGPPATRGHVCCKLKKKQSERERCVQIEQDNLRLLQKMEAIMKRNRLDNHWVQPQPTFLRRVGMFRPETYDGQAETTYRKYITFDQLPTSAGSCGTLPEASTSRKERCTACFPSDSPYIMIEERLLPWEQELAAKHFLPPPQRDPKKPVYGARLTVPKDGNGVSSCPNSNSHRKSAKQRRASGGISETPSLVLTRGNLQLAVNFPADTQVTLRDGNVEKLILNDLCKCKSIFMNRNVT